jgi:hypothetical protein
MRVGRPRAKAGWQPAGTQHELTAGAAAGEAAMDAPMGIDTAAGGGDFAAAALLQASFSRFANGFDAACVGPGSGMAAALRPLSAFTPPGEAPAAANGFVSGTFAACSSKRLPLIAPSNPLACAATR